MAQQPKSRPVSIRSIQLHSLNQAGLNKHQPAPGALPLTLAAIAARHDGTNRVFEHLYIQYNKAHFLVFTMGINDQRVTGVALDFLEGKKAYDRQPTRAYALVKVVMQCSDSPEIGYVILYTGDPVLWRGLSTLYALPAGLVYDPTFDDFAFLGLA